MFAYLRHSLRSAACLAVVSWSFTVQPARDAQAVLFQFEYADAAGQGFFDPILGAERRAAMEYTGEIWGSLLPSAYVGEVINVRAVFKDDIPLGAGAGSLFLYPAPTRADTHFSHALANHLSGYDVDPDKYEIYVEINPNSSWYYGIDGNAGSDELDFVSTALHEIAHGLGYDGTLRANGSYGYFGNRGYDPDDEVSGWPMIYDQFLTLGPNGTRLLDLNQSARAAAVSSGNVYWNGPVAVAANGGPPQLYAPSPYEDGSSLYHVDPGPFPDAMMTPEAVDGVVLHTPEAFERAILRDLGWDIAVSAATRLWTGLGPDNLWSTAANWSGNSVPRGGDSVVFGASPQTDVAVHYGGTAAAPERSQFLDRITFATGAPSYTLRFQSSTKTVLQGAGIETTANPQTIILQSTVNDNSPLLRTGANIRFTGTASAGDADFQLQGGGTGIAGIAPPHGTYYFDRHPGGSVTFDNNSNAGSASFDVRGGSGDGGPNAQVLFRGTSFASVATFHNRGGRLGVSLPLGTVTGGFGGETIFEDNATAAFGTFHNYGQAEHTGGSAGYTTFFGDSNAGAGQFHNHGATIANGGGGVTRFFENSIAGLAKIFNHANGSNYSLTGGRTIFQDSSSAGAATIENEGSPSQAADPGRTEFYSNASAGSATINNRGYITVGDLAGRTFFYDNSTAANATLRTYDGYSDHGRIEFRNQSTAASAKIFIENEPLNTASAGGYLNFYDNSTAAASEITMRAGANGSVNFYNNATAANAKIITETGVGNSGNIAFYDNSTAANANISLGESSYMVFYSPSTAADATIALANRAQVLFYGSAGQAQIVAVGGSTYTGGVQAAIHITGTAATAANSTITVNGATAPLASPALVQITGTASPGNATLIANGGANGGAGGKILFNGATNGSTARLVANAGAFVDFWSQAIYNDISFGSIEGAGTFHLRGAHVITGSRNTSTTVSGPIVDTLVYPTYTGGRLTKVGTGTLTLAGTNTYTGLTTVNGGTLRVASSGSIAGDVAVNTGGRLEASNNIGGKVMVNGGVYAPGTSPGTSTIGGLTMLPASTLEFELGDPLRDRIVLTGGGNISLGGTLKISLLDGFAPALGQSFALFEGAIGSITGAFDSIIAPTFNGQTFSVLRNANSVVLQVGNAPFLAGDYNGNGIVDAADYALWRNYVGSGNSLLNDDTPGVGADDYTRWRAHFGQMAGTGAGTAAGLPNRAVPEPAALALSLVATGLVGLISSDRRCKKRRRDSVVEALSDEDSATGTCNAL